MGKGIYTGYKETEKFRRGSFSKGVFYRPNAPLVRGKYLSLEPDVIKKLEKLNCEILEFTLRNGEKITIPLQKFKDMSKLMEIGNPDKRIQYFFDISNMEIIKNEKNQLNFTF
jgi:hypothetical protein